MEVAAQLFTARVMHKRIFPRVNAFSYRLYYLAMPLPAVKLPGIMQQFPANDLGYRDGRCPEIWAREILAQHHLNDKTTEIILLTMPRVLGYVFNPVSFYLCYNAEGTAIAVICEVHNTFGEQHSYLCCHADHRPITAEEWMEAEKVFHVSPFLERSGHYRFRFEIPKRMQAKKENLSIWIDYYDRVNHKQLITSLIGTLSPLNRKSLSLAFWKHPLITLKAIALIHWQAVKLLAKGIHYIPKPEAIKQKISLTHDLTKM